MKILPVSSDFTQKRLKPLNKVTNPVREEKIQSNVYNTFQVYNMHFGKDIVSFKGKSFNKTLDDNYFHLPEGCTPDAFQIEAGKALHEGKDVIVEAPTGTGKTAIAYYAAAKNMEEGKKTFYTAPLKALSNQKLNELKDIFGKDMFGEENVGILTGDRRENVDAPILIMTTEVYRNMALSNKYGEKSPLMENLGTVVFDEFHYLGDKSRGQVWEESLMYTPEDVQTLALSATVGKPEKLRNWIHTLKSKEKDTTLISIPSSARHVPLQFDTLETNAYAAEEKRIRKSIKKMGCAPDIQEEYVTKPTLGDFKLALDKLSRKEQLPAIFFVFSKDFSKELVDYISSNGKDLTTKEEKQQIDEILYKHKSKNYIGADLNESALRRGYAVHNSGILPPQKALIEELFQKKLIKAVIATETLSAGINMPAKTVIISHPYKPVDVNECEEGKRLLTSNEFKQMSGRAGRRGIDTTGYVYTMPTSKQMEMDYLMLESMDSDELSSSYNPDYPFLTAFYETHNSDEELAKLYGKTFYSYSEDETEHEARTQELMDVSAKKKNLLINRGYLKQEDGQTEVTQLGKMASVVKGYDSLLLAELMEDRTLQPLSDAGMAMIAASIANNAGQDEEFISNETDLSPVFMSVDENVKDIYDGLQSSVNHKLEKFGKNIDSFDFYDDIIDFVSYMEKPEMSEEEAKAQLKGIESKLQRINTINKTTGRYTVETLVEALKRGDTIPTKVLEDNLLLVEKYKSRINSKNISDYIEKLNSELESQDFEAKGNKAKARMDKKRKELESNIRYAENMRYLDENIINAIASNYEFIKKNPPQQVRSDYDEIDELYTRLTSKDILIDQVKGLESIMEYVRHHSFYAETSEYDNKSISECYKKLIGKSMELYSAQAESGIDNVPVNYNKTAAIAAYYWTMFNEVNTDSMSNWKKLLALIPGEDEGTIYRMIMQSADLLSQIKEMAEIGYKNAQTAEEKKYYFKLKGSAGRARNLMLKEPVNM